MEINPCSSLKHLLTAVVKSHCHVLFSSKLLFSSFDLLSFYSTRPSTHTTQKTRRLVDLSVWRILSEVVSLPQDSTSKSDVHRQEHANHEAEHTKHDIDRSWIVAEELMSRGNECDLQDIADTADEDDGAVHSAKSRETTEKMH